MMPPNMSFMLTTDQVRARTKTVTRRLGWDHLKVGDVLNACVKCQGLKRGESIEKICQIRIVSVRPEPLNRLYSKAYGRREVALEGFPEMTPMQFVAMFCEHMKADPYTIVNRIEFEYIDQ